jgi:2-iminoacetate synthase
MTHPTPIDETAIQATLESISHPDSARIRAILEKGLLMKGLELKEVAELSSLSDPELLGELFAAARKVKDEIYGKASGDLCPVVHLQLVRQ